MTNSSILPYILIFLIVLFLYLHILNEFKTGNKLSIYEIDYVSNTHLQEICELKQPFIFDPNMDIMQASKEYVDDLSNNEQKDMKLYSSVDKEYVFLDSKSALRMLQTTSNYYSEHNWDFVRENSRDLVASMNTYWRPYFTLNTYMDVRAGCENVTTQPRFHKHNRMFLLVMNGTIHVKMTTQEYTKYLKPYQNYEHMENNSDVNLWGEKIDKNIKFVEFSVPSGRVLFIPPYWTFSIKYDANTLVYEIFYMSILNSVLHVPDYAIHFVQKNNSSDKLLEDFKIHKEEEGKEEVCVNTIEETQEEEEDPVNHSDSVPAIQ